MEPLPESRLDKKLAAVTFACLSSAGISGVLLYRDFTNVSIQSSGPALAKIERREARVRRKPAKSFAWNSAATEEKLYVRDSVQTSSGSGATIRFNNGNLIELGENSLVVIEEGEKLSLDYVKGSVIVHTQKGDERVTVGDDGKVKVEQLKIQLLTPTPLARIYTHAASQSVSFSWKTTEELASARDSKFTIEISQSRKFSNGTVKKIELADSKISSPFPPGTYFWRVSAQGQAITEPRQFSIVAPQTLNPVSPGEAETLSTFGEQVSVQFKWSPPLNEADSDAASTLQLSDSADFGRVVSEQGIDARVGVATLHHLTPGRYWWRIQSRYEGLELTSKIQSFSLSKVQRPTITLGLPEAGVLLEKLPSLRFSWGSDTEGLGYVFEIQSKNGSTVISENVNSSGFLWKSPVAGLYRWRVTGTLKGRALTETDWRAFTVFDGQNLVLQAPAPAQEIRYWEKPPSFEFNWKADELVNRQAGLSYQVQLATDLDFKSARLSAPTRESRISSEVLKPTPGSLFWRVRIVDEQGEVLKSSEPRYFVYGVYPELEAPAPISPSNKTVFATREKEQAPLLQWSESKYAQSYELSLYRQDSGAPADLSRAQLISKTNTSKKEAEFRDLPVGTYFWTVRALDPLHRWGHSMQPQSFVITQGELLAPPEITSEEVQQP